MQHAVHCVRLLAEYESFGRAAHMVFHVDVGHVPDAGDCQNVTEIYGLWENSGTIVPFGYFVLRSQDSFFTGSWAYSIDPASKASFLDGPFRRPGGLPFLGSSELPTSIAPLVYWNTSPERRHRGRTYAVGVVADATTGESDGMSVSALYQDALVTQFESLILQVAAVESYQLVLVEYQSHGVRAPIMPTFPCVGCHMDSRPMGTQRRRSRRGR